jgi:hypothetical protein
VLILKGGKMFEEGPIAEGKKMKEELLWINHEWHGNAAPFLTSYRKKMKSLCDFIESREYFTTEEKEEFEKNIELTQGMINTIIISDSKVIGAMLKGKASQFNQFLKELVKRELLKRKEKVS